jgi:hypothetical protein
MGIRRKEYTGGMAFGHNAAFLQNPFGYIQKNPINQQDLEGFAWKRADASARQKEDARVIMQTLGTELSIDLLYTGNKDVLFCLCDARFPAPKETPINVYWVPFKTGKLETLADIGFADVPKQNPAYDFVFTPGMNGCSLVVTEHPSDATLFRVYHYQSPSSYSKYTPRSWGLGGTGFPAKRIYEWLSYSDYQGDPNNPFESSGFNFMHYENGGWWMYSQPLRRKHVVGAKSLTMELSSKRSFRRAIPLDGYLKFESHRRVFQDDSVLSSKKKAPKLPKRSAEV